MAALALVAAVAVVPALLAVWPDTDVPVWAALATPFLLLTQFQWSLYQAQGDVRRMLWVILMRSVIPLLGLTVVAVTSPGDIGLAMLVWAASQIVVPLGDGGRMAEGCAAALHRARPIWSDGSRGAACRSRRPMPPG